MSRETLDGTRSGPRPVPFVALTGLLLLLFLAALATVSAAQGDLELAGTDYDVNDGDGDGLPDGVTVDASVHNGNDSVTKGFTLEVVLEHTSQQIDLRTTGGLLVPNATANVSVRVSTGTGSPAGDYQVRVVLHLGDLLGEVKDTDSSTASLWPEGDYQLTLEANRTSARGRENTTIAFTLTVTSDSNNPTGVDLTVDGVLGWDRQLSNGSLQLAPGTSTQVTLTVSIPRNAPAGSRETLTVESMATRDGTAFDSLTVTVTVVDQVFMLDLALLTSRVMLASGDTVDVDGYVVNRGNNQDNVTLYVDADEGWTFAFEPPHMLLDRGEAGAFVLHLTAPPGLSTSGEGVFNVSARSRGMAFETEAPLEVVYNLAELGVVPADLSLSPKNPASGQLVTLQAKVTNAGSVVARNVLVTVVADGEELARTTIDTIPPGGVGVATITLTAEPGSRLLRVTADPDDTVPETDEANNVATITLTVTSPDLAVTTRDIVLDPSYPVEGEEAVLRVTVVNKASLPTGPFDVAISLDGDPLDTLTVDDGLSGGSNITLEIVWNASAGRHEFSVMVDPGAQVQEEDRANNGASRSFSVNGRPVARLVVLMTEITAGDTAKLDGSTSTDPDGRVRQFFFDYGDGTDSGWIFSPSINHTYTQKGTYELRLYVRDETGAQNLEPSMVVLDVEGAGDGDDGDDTPTLPAWAAILALASVAGVLGMSLGRRARAP